MLSNLIVCKSRRDVTICSPARQCRETLKVSKESRRDGTSCKVYGLSCQRSSSGWYQPETSSPDVKKLGPSSTQAALNNSGGAWPQPRLSPNTRTFATKAICASSPSFATQRFVAKFLSDFSPNFVRSVLSVLISGKVFCCSPCLRDSVVRCAFLSNLRSSARICGKI